MLKSCMQSLRIGRKKNFLGSTFLHDDIALKTTLISAVLSLSVSKPIKGTSIFVGFLIYCVRAKMIDRKLQTAAGVLAPKKRA